MPKIIGIDLGTTNSVAAVFEVGQAKVILNRQGSRVTPSVVGFTTKGERLIGQQAKHQQITNPQNTINSIKRLMGRRGRELNDQAHKVPYKIVGNLEEFVAVEINGRSLTPPEISAAILQELKLAAEEYLGEEIEQAVITVPAYFDDAQRQATKDAGEIAGLQVVRIVNEPTAAALAYGLDKQAQQTILVFDLGGGTLDVSVLKIDPKLGTIEVQAVSGDTYLGGDDYDNALVDFIANDFYERELIDLRKDPICLQRLKEAAENAKCELSSLVETCINLPFISATSSGPKHLQITLLRAQFEQITKSLTERCRRPIMDALEAAKLTPASIDEVVLVGGSIRMPAIQNLVRSIFNKEPNKSINPDEVVALGAAIQAAIIAGEKEDMVLLDVTPLTLGVETLGGLMTPLIEANTTIPTSKTQEFSTAVDGQSEVSIHVLQGNRKIVGGNRSLGRFNLTKIVPAPRGVPKIEVTFNIDRNGILMVTARDKGTGQQQSIRIESSSGLSDEDIDRMRNEAEQNLAQDQQVAELARLRNSAQGVCDQADELLRGHSGKIPDRVKSTLEVSLRELRSAAALSNAASLKSALERTTKDIQEIGKLVYGATTDNDTQVVS